MEAVKTRHELLATAKQAELDDDYELAINQYQQVLKEDELNEYAYDRLLVLYRRLKFYKEELSTINAGIKAFEKFYKPKLTGTKGKKIAELSAALLKRTGLADKKGNTLYEPGPIAKWKKRKLVVEKRLKK